MKILVVDDDRAVREALRRALTLGGYEVELADGGTQALELLVRSLPDAVVLDVAMPDVDGLEVCRRLRSISSVPIIILTAKSEEIDKVVGLELGADDYITKPFSMREFRSRVKAALRRAGMGPPGASGAPGGQDEQALLLGELAIDFAKRSVRVRGEHVQTTFVEFEILGALALSPGRVFTRDVLLSRIWGDSAYRDPRTIDVHIRHLREKLERDAKEPEYLFTVRGVGYRFRDDER